MTTRKTKIKVILPRKFQLEALGDVLIEARNLADNVKRIVNPLTLKNVLDVNDRALLAALEVEAAKLAEKFD